MGGMNQTPASERVHIGFFGKRNAGKSSVMNKVTGQNLAVVSDVKGTTTDPVYKAMELLPLGPVVMMDTPGIDDEGELGSLRVKKSYQVLNKTDAAVLVIDGKNGMSQEDQALLERIKKKKIPSILVLNKRDMLEPGEVCQTLAGLPKGYEEGRDFLWVSAREGTGIQELKEKLAILAKPEENQKKIIGDLLSPGDFVVLVVPIDKAAPKGRLILPQQQTIRDILDSNGISVVVKEDRLKETLEGLGKKPRMVITDSQVFKKVSQDTPGGNPSYILLHFVCQVQGKSGNYSAGSQSPGESQRRRPGADQRRLHPSQTVRGYRHSKASCMDTEVYRKKTEVFLYLRNRIP